MMFERTVPVIPRSVKIGVLIVEALILLAGTFGYLIGLSFFVGDDGRPSPSSVSDWYYELVIPLGGVGLLALWIGFIVKLVLEKNINAGLLTLLYIGFLLGAVADITFFYGSATIGHGYVGLGFSGWLMIAALYGGPLAICAHIMLKRIL